jgi:hypothetical protein
MTDPLLLLTSGAAVLIGLVIVAAAALRGWSGWLELRRTALTGAAPPDRTLPPVGARIEIADLKERVRRLEAIASGIE